MRRRSQIGALKIRSTDFCVRRSRENRNLNLLKVTLRGYRSCGTAISRPQG